jgi:hypothetical protein
MKEAQDQLRTGHRDIRTFLSDTTVTPQNTIETAANANTTTDNTATGRIGPQRNEARQRPQQTRTQPAPALTKFRRPGYQNIRNILHRAPAWTKTMQPTIRISISEAQNLLRTGHQDIRTFFSDTAATERNTNETLATANTTTDNTATGRIGPRRTEVRQ